MISAEEVPQYLSKEIPELDKEINNIQRSYGIHKVLNVLVDYTNRKLGENNYQTVQHCFAIVEGLYSKGNNIIKNAVENVYVYALDKMLMACNCDKQKVQSLLPHNLYRLYVGQMVNSNI